MNILAIDQGTSATKALLVGPGNEILGRAEVPVTTTAAGGDGVEADPEELWSSVVSAGERALAAARAAGHVPVHAVALANQGETVLAWDKASGRPLSRAIVWQDRRSVGICERLSDQADDLRQVTGLPLDPYFAAPKMTWLRENVTDLGVITTTDTWLLHRLGAQYVTDASTASRTMLLDLDAARWSERACDAFGIDAATLPRVADCAGVVGETTVFGGRPLPVAGIAVDQQAALYAHGCVRTGDAKCTYGTGAFLLVTTGEKAPRSTAGLSASVAWRLAGKTAYCLDGQVYTAGSALRWLTEIGVLPAPADLDAVAGTVPDSGGVTFVPALAGLGAPHWAPHAKGQLAGLTMATAKGHIARAVVEGIAASVAVLAGAVAADLGDPLTALRVDGGLTRSRVLLQAQADLLGVPVLASRTPDATALGVAALARLGQGETGSPSAEVELTVRPVMSRDEAAERLSRYSHALTSTLS
ncbi:carbohydrate kinase [Trebonia kvetii]|uniref:ATP:glycerol 3-phosphotransferase n=1 Tax=Trebonia kvetii TaxID=2480626 RepID=A0A6P2BUN9_9ACTN|nr:FGGY family carbohydrate kinase [Trebonia kvetii]TVZ02608.1 carbohydrate kinase [Trebonia kvetii]